MALRDLCSTGSCIGFWRMARAHWNTGFGERHRSLSKKAFLPALQRLIPELTIADQMRWGGIRV